MKIPKRHVAPGRGMHPRYISQATKGLGVVITGPTAVNVTQPLTPTSNGCSSSLANTVCEISFVLAPCPSNTNCYSATLTTYDTVDNSGNVLSAAQNVAFNIAPAQTETVPLTLSGVPHSLAIRPLGANAVANLSRGIDLFGAGTAHQFTVQALDADGNVIFGAGSPTFTVAQTAGSLTPGITQPTTASPNVFTITTPAAYSSATATIGVTAAYTGQATDGCLQAGANCTASVVVDMMQLLAVGDTNGRVTVYEGNQSNPYANVSAGLSSTIRAVAFDAAGNLYVANCNVACPGGGTSSDNIAIFAPPYNGAPTMMATGVVDPQAIAFNAAGQLFVANCGSCSLNGFDSITVYNPPFTNASHPIATITNNVNDPVALAFDSSNNLWVADCASCGAGGTDVVTAYAAPSYTGTPSHVILSNLSGPVSIALDAANDLFVADEFAPNAKIFYASNNYQLNNNGPAPPNTITSVNSIALTTPVFVLADGPGNLFIADRSDNAVFRCQPPFTSNTCGGGINLSISNGVGQPVWMNFDGLGNLYVADRSTNAVTSYSAAASFGLLGTVTNNTYTPFAMAVLP